MAKVKKKKLSDAERISKAAEEVLNDELKYCKGRLNSNQITSVLSMIDIKRRKKYDGLF